MLVLIGSRTVEKQLWEGLYTCRHCLGRYSHDLRQRTEWGTLFFVPLVPLRVERLLTCHHCGFVTKLSKAAVSEFSVIDVKL